MMTAVLGLQTFWIARALDALRDEMHRGFDGLDARIDRLDARIDRLDARIDRLDGPEPPSLRRA